MADGRLSPNVIACLEAKMEWVIPTDDAPGAGSDVTVSHLLALLASLPERVMAAYENHLPRLTEADLGDPAHPFAPMFIDHVRDVYYGFPDTGAWSSIGFEVRG